MDINEFFSELGVTPGDDTLNTETGTTDAGEGAEETSTDNNTNTGNPNNQVDAVDAVINDTTKAGAAFAQMRTENKRLTDTIKGIAESLGLNAKGVNSDSLIKDVQDAIIKAKAAQNNIPEELLTRLSILEQREQENIRSRLEQETLLGLQNLKNTYNLDGAALKKFLEDLQENGKNPFEQSVDLITEYKMTHFDEILQAAVDKALLEDRQRASKADQHSSKPNTTVGGTTGEQEKINTYSALTKFLEGDKA